MNTQQGDNRMLNTKQISEMFHVSEETVRRWIRNGELKAEQDGKSYLVDELELERFVEIKAKTPGTSIGNMATFIPTVDAVSVVGAGLLAGGSIFKLLKTVTSMNNKVNTDSDLNINSAEDLDFHIKSIQRKRKKLILEHEIKLLDIDEEIATYEKMKEGLR
jgi:excisionase family DNA binding protein